MSLNKAIKSGKEHRKEYKGSKALDRSCRNHGSCPYCMSNRLHADAKRMQMAQDELQDYFDNLKEV